MDMNDPLMIFFLFIALVLSYTIPGPEENTIIIFEECVTEEVYPPPEDTEE